MSYETYRVADLIDEIAMGPFGSNIKVSCFVDSGVPVLNSCNLEGFSLSEKAFRYVTREKADSLNKANAHRGDIVITHRGTLGQIVFIPQDSRYDQMPLFLNANTVAQVLGVSISSAYELMHETGFPALRIGNRIVVPKEKFCRWVDAQTGGDA